MHGIFVISGKSQFTGNVAEDGGGIYMEKQNLSIHGSGTFTDNLAHTSGAVSGKYSTEMVFGGVIHFTNNHATSYGGAISVQDSTLKLVKKSEFSGNSAPFLGGALFVIQESDITLSGMHCFDGNSVLPTGYGGGIHILGSKLSLKGTQFFINNSAAYGGGLAFGDYDQRNVLYLAPNTSTHFINNRAVKNGGAIAVNDYPFTYCLLTSRTSCFPQIEENECNPPILSVLSYQHKYTNEYILELNVSLTFRGNLAKEGDVLYGGALAECVVCCYQYSYGSYLSGLQTFTTIASEQISDKHMNITSVPYQVCICENVFNTTELNCDRLHSLLGYQTQYFPWTDHSSESSGSGSNQWNSSCSYPHC